MEAKQDRSIMGAKATKRAKNNDQSVETLTAIMGLNRAALGASIEASEALMKAAAAFNAETLDFTTRFMNQAMSAGGSIVSSDKDWRGIINAQGDVATSLIEECAKETETVMTLTIDAMRNVAQPWTRFYWETLPDAMRPGAP